MWNLEAACSKASCLTAFLVNRERSQTSTAPSWLSCRWCKWKGVVYTQQTRIYPETRLASLHTAESVPKYWHITLRDYSPRTNELALCVVRVNHLLWGSYFPCGYSSHLILVTKLCLMLYSTCVRVRVCGVCVCVRVCVDGVHTRV